jgi:hypothetical protein
MRVVRNVGLAALVALLGAPLAGADLAPWDQGRVTAIAKQLAPAAEAWQQAVRLENDRIGSGVAVEENSLQDKARRLHEMSESLAAHLAKGKGHDETLNQYRSLREVADDTEEMAQRAELDAPALAAWSKMSDLLRQIAPYYDPKASGGTK